MPNVDIKTPVKSSYSPIPCGDSLTIPFRLNWDVNSDFEFDFNQAIQQTKIDSIQSVWVDNISNSNSVTFEIEGTDQRFIIDAGGVAAIPVISREVPRIKISSSVSANQTTRVLMNNFPLPMHTYTPTP